MFAPDHARLRAIKQPVEERAGDKALGEHGKLLDVIGAHEPDAIVGRTHAQLSRDIVCHDEVGVLGDELLACRREDVA